MSSLATGLTLALVGAVALNAGFVLQAHGAATAPELSLRRPLRAARALLTAPRWSIGFVTGVAGWILYLVALGFAPLSLVQAVSAGAVCLVVPLAAIVGRTRPRRDATIGTVIAAAGLAALAASLHGSTRTAASHTSTLAIGLVALAVLAVVGWSERRPSASLGGLAAGLGYGLGDLLSKLLLSHLPHHPGLLAVASAPLLVPTLACHAGAFLLLQRTFQRSGARGTVTVVGTMTAAMNVLPMAAGVLLLGDPFPRSPLAAAARLAAFAAVVVGARILAREQASHDGSDPGEPRAPVAGTAPTPLRELAHSR